MGPGAGEPSSGEDRSELLLEAKIRQSQGEMDRRRRALRGSGQSAVFTPVTDTCDSEGMIDRNTLDLDADFLRGNLGV